MISRGVLIWASLSLFIFVGCGGGDSPPPAEGQVDQADPPGEIPTADSSPQEASTTPPASTSPAEDPNGASATETPAPQTADVDATTAEALERRATLLSAMVSDELGARDAAVAELEAGGIAAKQSAAKLLRESSVREVRLGAAFFLLDRFDEADEAQRNGIVAALEDEESAVRNIALQLVLRSQPLTVANIRTVAKLMTDSTAAETSRIKAIRGLAKMPEEAAPFLGELRSAAREAAEPGVRSAAVYTLSQVDDGAETVAALADCLKSDSSAAVRKLAAARLGRMQAPVAGELTLALADSDAKVRQSAADSLGRLGPPAIPKLVAALTHQDAEVRRLSIYALGKNGSAAAPALASLQKLAAGDPDPQVKQFARLTMRVIQTSN